MKLSLLQVSPVQEQNLVQSFLQLLTTKLQTGYKDGIFVSHKKGYDYCISARTQSFLRPRRFNADMPLGLHRASVFAGE